MVPIDRKSLPTIAYVVDIRLFYVKFRLFGERKLNNNFSTWKGTYFYIKKFLETDYPPGSPDSYRAIEVFCRPDNYRDHFGLGAKNRPESFRDYILSHPELRKGNSDLPEGEVNSETPR